MARWQKNPKNFELVTREEAAAQSRKLYFTGKPCVNGHTAPRYVTTGGCLGCLTRFAASQAKNPFSHDLVPYVPIAPFWRSKRLNAEQLAGLDRYVQLAVDTYCKALLPEVCKACDGTHYVPMTPDEPEYMPGKWKWCMACDVPEPSTADVPTGTAP